MDELVINKRKYVLLPLKEYKILQKKAALKAKAEAVLSLKEARTYSRELIHTWANEK
jgi:hypothetical protein